MERLVKRFGLDAMMEVRPTLQTDPPTSTAAAIRLARWSPLAIPRGARCPRCPRNRPRAHAPCPLQVTPDAHQRLLTHMRKQKERARRHVDKRLAEKETKIERRGEAEARAGDREPKKEPARGRHEDYEVGSARAVRCGWG